MSKDQDNCVFCQIAHHDIPTHLRFEDEEIIAFDDHNPSAPIHVLIIPKAHIPSLIAVKENDQIMLGKLLYRAKLLADQLNIADTGYRVSINVGEWGGQIVSHLHLHLLGGAPLSIDRSQVAVQAKSIPKAVIE
ncbi:HIT domain-containing protein [Patescibacteria group bacterium]|nr:HIT domain-containing protein [Patescibacteria group bacterium]